MNELWAVLRNPRVFIAIVLGSTAVIGLLLIAQGWRGTAATLYVPFQLPYLVSGGLVGVATLGAALALLVVHVDRVEAAEERADTARFQREVLLLLSKTSAQNSPER